MKPSARDKWVKGGWNPIDMWPLFRKTVLLGLMIVCGVSVGIWIGVAYGAVRFDSAAAAEIKRSRMLEKRVDEMHAANTAWLETLDALKGSVERYLDPWSVKPPTSSGFYAVLPQPHLVEVFVRDGELWFEEPCGIGPDGLCLKRVTEADEELRWGHKEEL